MNKLINWWSTPPPPPDPWPSIKPTDLIPGTEYYIDFPVRIDDADNMGSMKMSIIKTIGTFMNLRKIYGKDAPFFCNIRKLDGSKIDIGLSLIYATDNQTNPVFDELNETLTSTKCPFDGSDHTKYYTNSASFTAGSKVKFYPVSTPELKQRFAAHNALLKGAAEGDFTDVIDHVKNKYNEYNTQNPDTNEPKSLTFPLGRGPIEANLLPPIIENRKREEVLEQERVIKEAEKEAERDNMLYGARYHLGGKSKKSKKSKMSKKSKKTKKSIT